MACKATARRSVYHTLFSHSNSGTYSNNRELSFSSKQGQGIRLIHLRRGQRRWHFRWFSQSRAERWQRGTTI